MPAYIGCINIYGQQFDAKKSAPPSAITSNFSFGQEHDTRYDYVFKSSSTHVHHMIYFPLNFTRLAVSNVL